MPPGQKSNPAIPHRFQRRGFSYERAIRFFFASNAGLTIVILLLIIVFLLKEGLGFFPGYRRELEIYRIAGLEFVDLSRKNLSAHEQLGSLLNRAYYAEINGLNARALPNADAAPSSATGPTDTDPLAAFRKSIDSFEAAGANLDAIVVEMTGTVTTTKEALQNADLLEKDRKTLLAAAQNAKDPTEREKLLADARASLAETVDTQGPIQSLLQRRTECARIHQELQQAAEGISSELPGSLTQPEAMRLLRAARSAWPALINGLAATPEKIQRWNPSDPVPLSDAVISFLTGKNWVTGGEWQDFYGILPLAVGSLMIAMVALSLAIPLGIGSAIYVNQFASAREQSWIKPVIEFIQAIPSVVLGFLGILVLGTVLRDISVMESLQWIPGFPIEERLNIFTAGCLLALMGIPTIFSLAEDALNNVPCAYAEASEALGASRVQTTVRVMIPAAFSGILAAILLGFGRVIGETMVVLLVAGNRIKIPDFSAGLGTIFQPTHTLTGIIAQELGEVPMGSVHYRALFVVGILLFAVVLFINATAHHFLHRAKK